MRYLPLTASDRVEMLAAIGVESVDALFEDVPPAARLSGPVDLPRAMGEIEVEGLVSRMAARNVAAGSVPFFIGGGVYRHHVPAAVDHLIQRGEFLTSYTPYQPEISQGTLQYLFEFQTQVALLTGMEVANASLYDGATACAEAVMMANRVTGRRKAVLSGGLHPHYREVCETYGRFVGFELSMQDPSADEDLGRLVDRDTSCVVVQNPIFSVKSGITPGSRSPAMMPAPCSSSSSPRSCRSAPFAPPGEMGADIVAAEGQSLGNALNFGGPHVGLFATRDRFVRQMPGRLVGQTVDADGRRGWVLTLSTREQHIRRERATSNICTNSGLCALAFTIHLALLGEAGLTRLARLNHAAAVSLAERLEQVPGIRLLNRAFFNEIRGPAAAASGRDRRIARRKGHPRGCSGQPLLSR